MYVLAGTERVIHNLSLPVFCLAFFKSELKLIFLTSLATLNGRNQCNSLHGIDIWSGVSQSVVQVTTAYPKSDFYS